MGLNFNILTDDPTTLNYFALYLSIKGYKDKETGKKVFPTSKHSLLMLGIATNELDGKRLSNRGIKNESGINK